MQLINHFICKTQGLPVTENVATKKVAQPCGLALHLCNRCIGNTHPVRCIVQIGASAKAVAAPAAGEPVRKANSNTVDPPQTY